MPVSCLSGAPRFCGSGASGKLVGANAPFAPVRWAHVDRAAHFYVNPATIIAVAAWKFQRVEIIAIQYRQENIAVLWNSVEDEMPHCCAAN
jgi:hypothetical protein